jgi:hypothetical protein
VELTGAAEDFEQRPKHDHTSRERYTRDSRSVYRVSDEFTDPEGDR